MAKYYAIGSLIDIKNALSDYYSSNVIVHADSGSLLIFECTQVSDKVIKLTGFGDMRAWYGDDFSGADITNQMEFGGTTTAGSTTIGYMVCGDTYILLTFLASTINSRVFILSQLTNDNYAVIGMVSSAVPSYLTGFQGFLTATNTNFYLASIKGDFNIGAKAFLVKPILITSMGALYDSNGYVSFKEIYAISKVIGTNIGSKGTGYFLTPSNLYTERTIEHYNSLFVEVSN